MLLIGGPVTMDCLAANPPPQQSDRFRQLNGCFAEQTLAEKNDQAPN